MFLKSILQAIVEYCEISSIHGLPLIVAKSRHIIERLFWIIIVVSSVIGAIALCLSNWQRYVDSPTVVSLEKDFRKWHNPFPAATGCFVERADEDLTNRFVKKQWDVEEPHEKYDYYVEFVKAVVNVSYQTMANFAKFQGDKTLMGVDLLDLTLQVHPLLTGDLVTFDTKRQSEWDIIITELGLCFTTNSKFDDIFIAKKKGNNTKALNDYLLACDYLNGLCYARFDSDPFLAIRYFVHSPYEVIHTTTEPPLLLPEKAELEINYQMQETKPAISLRRLSVRQRNCRFFDEPISQALPAYSTSICYILCRYKHAMKVCGCRPFFYHKLAGKICDVDGMICLSKHTDYFTQSATKMGCNCVEPCRVITYFPQAAKMTEWVSGYFDQRVTFRWGLLHPTTRYHRDILFGFEDLVVSFGGTASLFFGLSFLSVVEFIFFIIKKIIIHYFSKKAIPDIEKVTPIEVEEKLMNRTVKKANQMFVNSKLIPIETSKTNFATNFQDWRVNTNYKTGVNKH